MCQGNLVAAIFLVAASVGATGCATGRRVEPFDSHGASYFERLPLAARGLRDPAPRPLRSWSATASLAGAAATSRWLLAGPDEPRWQDGIFFDDRIRDRLRAASAASRSDAATTSDILRAGLWTWLLTDTALVRGWDDQSRLWHINLDAALMTSLGQNVFKYAAGRERPNASDNRSFYSGHAASAATAAGLLCAHHLHGELYGGGRRETVACSGAVALAAATGLARIVADEHYASDVLVGWAAGALVGYLLPIRWYESPGERERGARAVITPQLGDGTVMLHCALRW